MAQEPSGRKPARKSKYTRDRIFPEPGSIDHRPIKAGRFGHLPSKKPCAECPLARSAEPGRLGGYTAAQYLDILHSIVDIACHLSPGFPQVLETQRSCTGVAMYRANAGIIASGHAQEAMVAIGPDHDQAFSNPAEFFLHHQPWEH